MLQKVRAYYHIHTLLFQYNFNLIYFGPRATSDSFPLALGNATNNYMSEVTITILDSLGSESTTSMWVKVG